MHFTENFALPCLDDEDYAAVALYMQRLALETEAVIVAQQTEVDTVLNPPTDIYTTVNNTSPVSSGEQILDFSVSNTTKFQNYTPIQSPLFNAPFNGNVNTFPGPGIYQIGFFVNSQATGALTAASARQVRMVVQKVTGTGQTVAYEFVRRIQDTSIAGGDFFGTGGVFSVGADFNQYSILLFFSHENVASTMFVAAGAIAWRTRIGSTSIIEVV